VGFQADVNSNNLSNATAIGANAKVNISDALVLGDNAKIGIGTSSPSQKLHVDATGTNERNAGYFISNNKKDYLSDGAALLAENTIMGDYNVAAIIGRVPNTNQGSGYGGFFSSPYIGVKGYTEHSSGGTSPTYGVYGEGNAITTDISYGVYGRASGGAKNYGVFCNGDGGYTGTWTVVSDGIFKKDITQISSVLQQIRLLNPVSYRMKTDEYSFMNFPKLQQYGFVAQDLEKIFPILVQEGLHPGAKQSDPSIKFKTVNYNGMIPLLTKAIQEQQQIIDELLKRVEALEKK
jgi:hypothetical protein